MYVGGGFCCVSSFSNLSPKFHSAFSKEQKSVIYMSHLIRDSSSVINIKLSYINFSILYMYIFLIPKYEMKQNWIRNFCFHNSQQ